MPSAEITPTAPPTAITASHSGDVLLIRPGAYSAFTLSKGLTLLGSKGAHLVLQVTVVDPSGVTQRSNSLPVILR
ncbi:MAG TPA: hypothetical protein QF446_14420 [Planctomycetota bacterium]|nr:hypothetical protein [Planctomycetota bacterium]